MNSHKKNVPVHEEQGSRGSVVKVMTVEKGGFTDEQLDFLKEIMNIGSGNAAAALEQMLGLKTDLKIPFIKHFTLTDINEMYDEIGDSTRRVVAVLMNLAGQVQGKIIFVVPDEDVISLVEQVQKATPGGSRTRRSLDFSIIAEIGNILAGTFLSSIQKFCMLNIYHSIPKIKNQPLRLVVHELLHKDDSGNSPLLLFTNEFIIASHAVTTYLLFVPDTGSIRILTKSLQQAKENLSVPLKVPGGKRTDER